jgi:hypothetical protein
MFFSFKRASALIAPCAIAFPTLANITANATATIRFCIIALQQNFDMPINWKCAPADGTNAANDEDSARPLAARITGYLSRASVWRGVQ